MSTYLLDNAAAQAGTRFDALSAIFDAGTRQAIDALGIRDGWRCLEVGGGGGSVARWLADRVSPGGHVVATDIDPRHLTPSERPDLEVRRHDVTSDPLPDSAFDLVHARLVIMHLSDPARALARIAAALKPGGWAVIEDFGAPPAQAGAGTEQAVPQVSKTTAVMRHVMTERGIDLSSGNSMGARLRAIGFEEVTCTTQAFEWHGRSAGALIMRANYEQLADLLLATGRLTRDELQADLASLEDPGCTLASPTMWTVRGRRPR